MRSLKLYSLLDKKNIEQPNKNYCWQQLRLGWLPSTDNKADCFTKQCLRYNIFTKYQDLTSETKR